MPPAIPCLPHEAEVIGTGKRRFERKTYAGFQQYSHSLDCNPPSLYGRRLDMTRRKFPSDVVNVYEWKRRIDVRQYALRNGRFARSVRPGKNIKAGSALAMLVHLATLERLKVLYNKIYSI